MSSLIVAILVSCVLVGGSLFLLCLGITILTASVRSVHTTLSARRWPQANGVVTHSAVAEDAAAPGEAMYWPDINYRYQVAGTGYTSSQYSFTPSKSSGKAREAEFAARYPVDTPVVVQYDPKNPANAVLETPIGGRMIFGFFMGFSAIISGVFVGYLTYRDAVLPLLALLQ